MTSLLIGNDNEGELRYLPQPLGARSCYRGCELLCNRAMQLSCLATEPGLSILLEPAIYLTTVGAGLGPR